jgi:hypothetical protein
MHTVPGPGELDPGDAHGPPSVPVPFRLEPLLSNVPSGHQSGELPDVGLRLPAREPLGPEPAHVPGPADAGAVPGPGDPAASLREEARLDWEIRVDPLLSEIEVDLGQVPSLREEGTRILVRIRRTGAAAVAAGRPAGQAVTLSLLNDVQTLASDVQAAAVSDDQERALLDRIGEKISGRLGPDVWAVLLRLGTVREWSVHGGLDVNLGFIRGSGGISITFGQPES